MASLKKRGRTYYAQYYVGGRQKRVSLETASLQMAKHKLRELESSLLQGIENPFPTRTPIADVVTDYIDHIRTVKTERSVRADMYYLREAFGPICEPLQLVSPKISAKARRRTATASSRRAEAVPRIESNSFEEVATAQVSAFLSAFVRARGLAPKTANRCREVLHRLYGWAIRERGIRTPGGRNPVTLVERYRENAPKIRFLSLPQIEEQLAALTEQPQLQTMVAAYIFGGFRREELLWLRVEDVGLSAQPNRMIRIQAKTVDGETWQPKTRVNRAVPISRALRRYLDHYAPRPTHGDWYFPSPKGSRWDADNFSTAHRQANNKTKLPWGCLDYRHTFGSQLAMKGESLYKISALMGNSPEICRRHYAALLPESLAKTVDFFTEGVQIKTA